MRRIFFLIAVIGISVCIWACKESKPNSELEIAKELTRDVDSFVNACKALENLVQPGATAEQLHQSFLAARLAYKRIEWASEYFEPATARFVNGPPVQEIEPSGQIFEPAGLQVVEGILFPDFDSSKRKELMSELQQLQIRSEKYKRHFDNIGLFQWQIFDAAKIEIFRIETLGITGFDNPLTLNSMSESTAAIESVSNALSRYEQDQHGEMTEKIKAAIAYLTGHNAFDKFDRALFIKQFCDPITTAITNRENELNLRVVRYNRLLNQDAPTLFDQRAFNINAFAPNRNSFATPQKIALGKRLFFDPVLSGNNNRSCQSCHQPGKAFADGLVKNTVIGSDDVLRRNTPTLLNTALQSAQFYDLRVSTLEDQSLDVVQSSLEMHGSIKASVRQLWNDSSYQRMFREAFPQNRNNSIDTFEVMNALASYVRSLSLLNSRFDNFMRGDEKALTGNEIRGFNLFMGKAKCATCHYMPLFNGTFPPRYMKTEAEVIGVPKNANSKQIDDDPGRYGIIKVAALNHAFKTPTVRNAELTVPYMHNGVYATLDEVVDFYNKGGGAGLGLTIDNQTLPPDKLNLTDEESKDIVAFIKTLNSQY